MGKSAATDRHSLPSLTHSFTLDGLAHCQTEAQALALKAALVERFAECGLELHPAKTRIIYCQDDDRSGEYEHTKGNVTNW